MERAVMALGSPWNADRTKCGRPAVWISVGDVEEDGWFEATCRECYGRTHAMFPHYADNLVPALIFKDSFPRTPMCGDSSRSSDLTEAIAESAAHESKDSVTYESFERWRMRESIKAHAHRVAIDRRFERLEGLANRSGATIALAGGFYVANWVSRTVHRVTEDWIWYIVFFCATFVIGRWIELGRFRRHIKIE